MTSQDVAALKVLSECLGKGEKTLCYIYEECSVSYIHTVFIILCILCMHIATILKACCVLLQHAERIESVCRKPPARNQPRIIAMRGEEGVVEYFVICEQVLYKTFSLPHALFFCIFRILLF